MSTQTNIEAIAKALPHWQTVVTDSYLDGDDLNTLACNAIRAIDHTMAPTSETILLGYALDDLRHAGITTQPSLLEQLEWWGRAYEAYYQVMPSDEARERDDFNPDAAETRENAFIDALLHGDLGEAERIAAED